MLKEGCLICKIVQLFLVIGALNWGLVGLLDINLVTMIFGEIVILVKVIYILVGVAGIITILSWFKDCPMCKK